MSLPSGADESHAGRIAPGVAGPDGEGASIEEMIAKVPQYGFPGA